MKAFCFTSLLALGVLLAACGKEYIRDSPRASDSSNSLKLISLAPGLGDRPDTRSIVNGSNFPAENDIILSARWYAPGGDASCSWFDRTVFHNDGSVWTADKYWPLTGSLKFMAYSAQGMEFETAPAVSSAFDRWEMIIPEDYPEQQSDILFLFGNSATGKFSASSSATGLSFKHAMARLKFSAESNVGWDGDGGKGVIIDDICINNVYMSGRMLLYDDGEVVFDPGSQGTIEHLSLPQLADYHVPDEAPEELDFSLLVPPQGGTSITVTYTVHDGELYKQKTLDFEEEGDWEPNEMYVYKLSFDGESLLLELVPRYLKISTDLPNVMAITNPAYEQDDAPYLEYSYDKETWTRVPFYTGSHGSFGEYGQLHNYDAWTVAPSCLRGSEDYLLPFDSVIYLRGDNPDGLSVISGANDKVGVTQIWFNDSGNVSIDGDLTYLLSHTEPVTEIPERPYCFAFLFGGSGSRVVKAPDLNVETIRSRGCMYGTYRYSALTETPLLAARTVSERCYESTFQGCSNLRICSELPIENTADMCCCKMFYNSGLETGPEILPATTLSPSCYYQMFYGSNITIAPELPAAGPTYATDQYRYCYYQMFYNCTSLTETRAIALRKYYGCTEMFKNCSSLNHIIAYECSSGDTDWVYGVSESGVFDLLTPTKPKDAAVSGCRSNSHIPPAWQVRHLDTAYIWYP